MVVKDSLVASKKLEIAKDIIAIDRKPCPLEMSAIKLQDAKNWKSPGNCVFHYSDFWTEKYLERFDDPGTEVYVADHEFPDADVTDEDFFAAISADIDDYDFHDYAPRYFASNVLILGRILSFKRTKKILSKYDGGLWMIENVPADLKYLPLRAMKIWFENEEWSLPEEDLVRLRDYLVGEIKK